MRRPLFACLLALASATAMQARAAPPDAGRAATVLVLGDSQLSFGAGVAFVDLIGQMAGSCGLAPDATTAVIGVRSSTITAWTGRSRTAKGAICNVDKKWKVNAGVYGTLSTGDNPFVQIGQGQRYQFCTADASPLQAVFDGGYYTPDLVIMMLMGNAADRWAGSPEAALEDARAFLADVPQGQPCIFMTSAPPYSAKLVRQRQKAQENIEAAFATAGGRCTFVPGLTAATIQENQGNARNFRRNASGKVKDPYHPTEAAARRFLSLRKADLCTAIAHQLGGP